MRVLMADELSRAAAALALGETAVDLVAMALQSKGSILCRILSRFEGEPAHEEAYVEVLIGLIESTVISFGLV